MTIANTNRSNPPRRSTLRSRLLAAILSGAAAAAIVPLTVEYARGQPDTNEAREARQQAALRAARGEVTRAQMLVDAARERVRGTWATNAELLAAERDLEAALNELERARQPILARLRESDEYQRAVADEQQAERNVRREQAEASTAAQDAAANEAAAAEAAAATGTPGATGTAGAAVRTPAGGVAAGGTVSGGAGSGGITGTAAGATAAVSGSTAAGTGGVAAGAGTGRTTAGPTPAGGAAVGGATADVSDAPVAPLPPPTRDQVAAAHEKLEIRSRRRDMEHAAFRDDPAVAAAQQRADEARARVNALQAQLDVVLQNDEQYRAAFEELAASRARLARVTSEVR